MGRKEITSRLSQLTESYISPKLDTRVYWAREVTFDYYSEHPVRVDYMKFVPVNNTVSGIEKGDFYCYEVKSCVADFKSQHGHNFIGDYNYYVMTHELYCQVKDCIPYDVGALVATESGNLETRKRARRMNRTRSVCEMLLMMFRSANRDNIKLLKKEAQDAAAE